MILEEKKRKNGRHSLQCFTGSESQLVQRNCYICLQMDFGPASVPAKLYLGELEVKYIIAMVLTILHVNHLRGGEKIHAMAPPQINYLRFF